MDRPSHKPSTSGPQPSLWISEFVNRSEITARIPPRCLMGREVAALTGLSPIAYGHHMRLAGWREKNGPGLNARGERCVTVWWVPPGGPSQQPEADTAAPFAGVTQLTPYVEPYNPRKTISRTFLRPGESPYVINPVDAASEQCHEKSDRKTY